MATPKTMFSDSSQNDNSHYYTEKADLIISYFPQNGICGCEKDCPSSFFNKNILNKYIISHAGKTCD